MAEIPTSDPLNPLFSLGIGEGAGIRDPYNFTNLKYPEDIDDKKFNGHYVNFYINVNNIVGKYYTGPDSNYIYPSTTGNINYRVTNALDPVFGGGLEPGGSNLGGYVVEATTERITQAISLYIPDSMQYSQTIEWENSSVQEFGQKLGRGLAQTGGSKAGSDEIAKGTRKSSMKSTSAIGSLTSKIAGALGGTIGSFTDPKSTVNELLNVGGMAMNPQKLVLFRGIDFRTFQFEFYFTPRNEKESKNVREIIRAFRFHSHPEANILWGTFYTAPSTFDIEYIHKGAVNKNIQSAKTCILKNYSLDYAPNGWSTFTDGMPVQTRLILQFQELEVITKEDIERGF